MVKALLTAGCFALAFAAILLPKSSAQASEQLDRIAISDDKTHFVLRSSGQRILIWGFNYDHDRRGRLLEDYWADEWEEVVGDFREMKELGANAVRIHLQLAKFMDSAERPNQANLERLAKLLRIAEKNRLYLKITGLGCYHKADVPEWYDALSEQDRWEVQARFWEAVADVGRESPAVFCYDLMNEPIVASGDKAAAEWLAGDFGGKHFVQRINLDPAGRTREAIAKAWVAQMTAAIRKVDREALVTVGAIPWAYTFKGAKPLFYAPEVAGPLDFTSIHVYPKKDDLDGALELLEIYQVGKPLVIGEFFPLHCSIEQADEFIERSGDKVAGWFSFYWGEPIEKLKTRSILQAAITAAWLEKYQGRAPARE